MPQQLWRGLFNKWPFIPPVGAERREKSERGCGTEDGSLQRGAEHRTPLLTGWVYERLRLILDLCVCVWVRAHVFMFHTKKKKKLQDVTD